MTVCCVRHCTRPATDRVTCRDHGEAHQATQVKKMLRGDQ